MWRTPSLLIALASLGSCVACPPEPVETCVDDEALPEGRDGLTWHEHVRPLVEAKCSRCHTEGGLAPFSLDTLEEVRALAAPIKASVLSRRMPPWVPARCCNSFENDLSLEEQQIADLVRFLDEGAPEGDADVEPEAVAGVPGLERVDVSLLMPEPYTPAPAEGSIDDYRCFLVEWPLQEEKFVTGFSLRPSNPAVLHHALVLLLSPDQVKGYQDLEAGSDRPGFSCPGGGVLGTYGYLGGWSPGWDAQRTPEGLGHRVTPGSALVFSMHYSTPAHPADEGPDQTAIEIELVDEVDDAVLPIAVMDPAWSLGGMPIPANDGDVRFAYEYDPTFVHSQGEPLQVFGVNLHMHERGSAGSVFVKRQDGSTECLLQVDDYAHEWQGDYLFEEPVLIEAGDRVYAECRFDNTRARQRVIAGEREEPRDLNWGDDQEMCVAWLTASRTSPGG